MGEGKGWVLGMGEGKGWVSGVGEPTEKMWNEVQHKKERKREKHRGTLKGLNKYFLAAHYS